MAHETTRTGAPLVLLRWLEWLVAHRAVEVTTLSLRPGPLAGRFEALGPLVAVDGIGVGSRLLRTEAGLVAAGWRAPAAASRLGRLRFATRHLRGFDVAWINSATAALALRVLPERSPLVVAHVHELDAAINRWLPAADRTALLTADRWVAAASGVARNLERNGADPARVVVHHEFIDRPRPDPAGTAAVRAALGVVAGDVVVGASGSVDWRKAPELFVQLAVALRRRRPEARVRFVWVGGAGDGPGLERVGLDVARAGLGEVVSFVGEVEDPAPWFAAFDVFCLTSREDPFPLVCLEAMARGVPVVTFANGGMEELAVAGGGSNLVVVPYLDVEAMADAVVVLVEDPAARRALGDRGRDRVLTHHLTEHAAPALDADLAHWWHAVVAGRRRR